MTMGDLKFYLFVISAVCAVVPLSAASNLDAASGRLFKPDLENRSFEFLTETEYDPKTDIGQSRFTVHWAEDAEIVQMGELKDFSSVPGPITANFRGISDADAKALQAGEPFVARVATLFEGVDAEPVQDKRPGRAVSGEFTPDPDATRAGTILVDGEPVRVSLRKRYWRIFHQKRIEPERLTEGFWSVTMHGAEDDASRFVADRLEVESLPDPRLTDDPELPRVLVIGDSTSMNYHEAAMEVMKRHPEIMINDLYRVVDESPVFDNWRKGTDVHFYKEEERALIGETVAAAVRKALAKRSPQPKKNLPLPGEVFQVEGHTAFLIRPQGVRVACDAPMPWVWYAPTLKSYPAKTERWMFAQFLEAGVAVAGIDIGESMGNPEGRRLFSALYQELTTKRGMAKKPVLLARSRGGLMLYNWAAENPDKVAAIAGIYPVGNLASWPGLDKAAKAYGMRASELEEALADHNPIDRLVPIAEADVPILHLHGDKDSVVPLGEHSGLIRERYGKLGGPMQLIVIPGGGHDLKPHWFRNQELVDFVIQRAKRPEH